MLENAKLYDKDFDSNATRSWGATTVINGSTYATGLFWQPLQNRDDPYTEIEESAESVQEGADLFALKPGKTVQFGVCSTADGYKKGILSLAVAVSTAFSDKSSFVGVFKVDNGWWYCCVRNDIILSDGDMLFLKEEDAKEQLMSMLTVPDWGKKIAPAEWGFEDTEAITIDGLIENGVKAKLQKIKALRGPKLYAIVVVSGIVGFWIISSFVVDVLFAPKHVAPVVVAPIKPKVMEPVVEEKIIMPWETIKSPAEIMDYCYADIKKMIQIMPPGWSIGGLTCNDSGVTTSWSRDVGRISWIDKALNKSGITFSARSISSDGNMLLASTYYKVPILNSPPTYSSVDLKNIINDLFQSLDVLISLDDTKQVIKDTSKQNTYRREQNKDREYNQVRFSFSTPQNPLIWKKILTKFSGLMINSIMYDVKSGIWTYEGVIYVL